MSRPSSNESVFRAIADPTRRRILDELAKDDRTVGDLILALKLSRTAATFHLRALMAAGLIRKQRRGGYLMCSASPGGLLTIHAWVGRHVAKPRRSKQK